MRDRSITCAPAGIATFGPTSRMRVPSTRMIWLVRIRPASASSRRPARIAVTVGAAGGRACRADAASLIVAQAAQAWPARMSFSMALELSGGAAFGKRHAPDRYALLVVRDQHGRHSQSHCRPPVQVTGAV